MYKTLRRTRLLSLKARQDHGCCRCRGGRCHHSNRFSIPVHRVGCSVAGLPEETRHFVRRQRPDCVVDHPQNGTVGAALFLSVTTQELLEPAKTQFNRIELPNVCTKGQLLHAGAKDLMLWAKDPPLVNMGAGRLLGCHALE